MPRDILLMRHGKARRKADSDFHRSLKNRGKRAAQRMGAWLAGQDLLPDIILTSPAVRARETAHKACKAMGLTTERIREEPLIYLGNVNSLFTVLGSCPADAQRVLLVGHNPGLEALLCQLVMRPLQQNDERKLLPTAALAHLQTEYSWDRLTPGCADLQGIKRPRQLPDLFPFPLPGGGMEQRERPAYYYTQSAVIPYRLNDGKPEILIITSSSGRHWVVPKGIAEPGLSLQASAEKEAREEAGVTGHVQTEALGHYRYPKWGAECSVAVYAMQVSGEIPEDEREEQHRERQWATPEEVMQKLHQPSLAEMIPVLTDRLENGPS